MIIFSLAFIFLVLGYLFYSKYVERVLGVDENRKTPAIKYNDGVDFVPMPIWRVFLIQFLNIAGLGPVFGAILGAVYGPVCLLWIVFGCIFAGGVHDFFSGMLSLKYKGKSIVYLTEKLFCKYFKIIFLIFFVGLLILLGTVFAINPAKMLANISHTSLNLWICVIFGYYFLTTLLPVDKLIGRLYPFFALLLIVMTCALMFMLIKSGVTFYPDLTALNLHPNHANIFPLLFVTVACGAVSGFHATQSPIMARCLPNEKNGRAIFYGAMVTEGIIALIWATLGIAFYQQTGGLLNAIDKLGQGGVVSEISTGLLGHTGGILTVLSIIVLSITSGDTAFRSIRITIADFLHWEQKSIPKRLLLSTIILSCGVLLSRINLTTLWQYFGWANQALSSLVLWTVTYYLMKKHKNFYITLIPAIFMTSVVVSYIFQVKIGFNLSSQVSNIIGILVSLLFAIIFFLNKNPDKK
ncbi:carbon starvation protein A [bacterium]|nr:carbon starvation protein A [bacterium]